MKKENMEQYHYLLRIAKRSMNKLAYIADYEGRSINKELVNLVNKRIHEFEKKHGEIVLEDGDRL